MPTNEKIEVSEILSQLLESKREAESLMSEFPDRALNAARVAAEKVCIYFLLYKDLLDRDGKIPDGLEKLRGRVKHHAPAAVDQHIRTLQTYGNRGSHFQLNNEPTSTTMVSICLLALSELVDWFLSDVFEGEHEATVDYSVKKPLSVRISEDKKLEDGEGLALDIIDRLQRRTGELSICVVDPTVKELEEYIDQHQYTEDKRREVIQLRAEVLRIFKRQDRLVEAIATFVEVYPKLGFGDISTSHFAPFHLEWFLEGLVNYMHMSWINPAGIGYDIYRTGSRGVTMQIPVEAHEAFLESINVKSVHELQMYGGCSLFDVGREHLFRFAMPGLIMDFLDNPMGPDAFFSLSKWKVGLK